MAGTHGFDMINTIKRNQQLKANRSRFQKSDNSSNHHFDKYEFKTPTQEDLNRLESSNQDFLKQQARYKFIALMIFTVLVELFFRWVYEDWDYVESLTSLIVAFR
jgi:hypothetical protein